MKMKFNNMLKQIINALTKEQKVDLFARDILPQTISYWKVGKRRPTYAQCISLAEITGADLPKLLTEVALNDGTPEQQEKFKHLIKDN